MAGYLSMIGDAIGGLIGGSNSGKASARQYQYNLALQQQAQRWNEKAYKHRYQWQVEDLKNAGINTLYGLGTAPAITSGLNSVGLEDDQGAKNGRMQNAINLLGQAQAWSARKVEMDKMKAETQTEKVKTNLTALQAVNQQLNNIRNEKENNWYDKRAAAELEKTRSEITGNIADATYKLRTLDSTNELNRAQAANARSAIGKNRAEAENIKENTNQLKQMRAGDIEMQKQTAEFMKNHPKAAKAIGGANALAGILGQLNQGTNTINNVGRAGTARNRKK